MKWLWHLHREWKDRVRKAEAEVERSRRDLTHTREQVVTPLSEWRKHNHFARLIYDSLLNERNAR